jgi:hypothetical protein
MGIGKDRSKLEATECQSAFKIGSYSVLKKFEWFQKGINMMQRALRPSALVPRGFDVEGAFCPYGAG